MSNVVGHRSVLFLGSALLLVGASFLVPALPAGADTAVLYVSPSGTGDCTSSGNPCASVQMAITTAEASVSSDVTIEVAAGTYDENDTVDVPTGDTLTVRGTGAAAPTVNGGGLGSVFTVNGGTVTIDNVTIDAGAAGTSGGGVDNAGGTVTLTNDTLVNDTAATSGGGFFNAVGATAVLVNDTLASDSAGMGGGVDNQGSVTLTNVTLANDTATTTGGGIESESGATTSVANSVMDASPCAGSVMDGGYNVESDNSCGLGTSDVVNSASIDLAASLAANGSSAPETLAIGRDSSAFEEVPSANCTITTDERGDARPGVAGANCDAGSFEDQIATASLSLSGSPVAGNNTFDVSLVVPSAGVAPSEAVSVADSASQSCSAALAQSTATLYIGSCTIDAESAGVTVAATYNADGADPNYLEATSNPLTVQTMGQSIAFTSSVPSSPTVGGTYTVSATGGASGNPVTFTIDATSTAGACSITGSTVSLLGVGNCIVDANQAGDTNYAAAPEVQQHFSVLAHAQSIAFTSSVPSSPTVGGIYTVSATGGASGNPVTFTIDATSAAGACTITDSTVSLLGVGLCVIDANQTGNTDYTAATQSQQGFSIEAAGGSGAPPPPGSQSITFTSSVPSSPTVGGTYVVSATGGASGNPVTFTIDATSAAGACTITGSTVSLLGVGLCVIDANQTGNTDYTAATQSEQSFSILLGRQTITFTSSVPSSPKVGGTYVVSATGGASGRPVTFSISATSTKGACAITGSKVSLLGVGTCVIDANQAASVSYSAAPEVHQSFVVRSGTSPGPPVKPAPKIVIHLDTFTKSGRSVHESVQLICVRATCSGLVRSLGHITTTKKVSVKAGKWTITKKVNRTLRVVLTSTPYRLAKGKSGILTLTVSASGQRALAEANSKTPFFETITATVQGGLMATKSSRLH